jgi:hypothetical protein
MSKCGEVLLMKKMGFLEPSALPSSAAKCLYNSYFKGDLSTIDVEALDKLFPACNGMFDNWARRPLAMGP